MNIMEEILQIRSFIEFLSNDIKIDTTDAYTPCPRKNCNPVYVAITLANNVGF